MSESTVVIDPDGRVRFIWSDELAGLLALGTPEVRRGSHVEPTPAGQWEADLAPVGGPKLGPFTLRSEALQAETEWLTENWL